MLVHMDENKDTMNKAYFLGYLFFQQVLALILMPIILDFCFNLALELRKKIASYPQYLVLWASL